MMEHKLEIYNNCSVTCTDILPSFSDRKMTLAELKTLVETMQNLPCVMNHLEEVQARRLLACIFVRFYSSVIFKMYSKIYLFYFLGLMF